MIMKKTVILTLIIILAIMAFCPIVSVAWSPIADLNTIQNIGDNSGASNAVRNTMGGLLRILQVIAIGVAVIMLVILGMKYMVASAGEKAEIKKHAVVYVVGAVVMFGAAGILEIINLFASRIGA